MCQIVCSNCFVCVFCSKNSLNQTEANLWIAETGKNDFPRLLQNTLIVSMKTFKALDRCNPTFLFKTLEAMNIENLLNMSNNGWYGDAVVSTAQQQILGKMEPLCIGFACPPCVYMGALVLWLPLTLLKHSRLLNNLLWIVLGDEWVCMVVCLYMSALWWTENMNEYQTLFKAPWNRILTKCIPSDVITLWRSCRQCCTVSPWFLNLAIESLVCAIWWSSNRN